jgi:hypothetical protein
MKKAVGLFLFLLGLLLGGCTSPDASGIKVIVGAKLVNPAHEPIDYSVIVIEGGKITAAGPQSSVPVPKGSAITRGIGMTVEPESAGDSVEPGRPANLILKGGGADRKMHDGEWVNP